jgi:hypothetical protein
MRFRSFEYKKGLVMFASISTKLDAIRAFIKPTSSSQEMSKQVLSVRLLSLTAHCEG